MKVIMLIDSLVRGGRERRLIELLKAFLPLNQLKVSLVIFSKKVEYPEVLDMNIPIYYLERNPSKDPRVFFRLYHICKKEQPDILHCWGWMSAIYGIPSAKLLGIKLLNASITDAVEGMNLFDSRYFRAKITFPFSDMIVGNSKAGIEAYRAPKSKSYCVYNGFDFHRIGKLKSKEIIKETLNIPKGKVVGMVAGFYDRKDYDTYIEVACAILKQRKDICFLAIGDGPKRQSYIDKIPLDLRKRVLFTGQRNDIESIVNIFDIGILSSFTEGISNSIMEYMVLGKPVIASGRGGIPELVNDGETGFVIPSQRPQLMIEKINQLLDDPDLCENMGKRGKQRIYDHFTLANMERTYLELYNKLVIGQKAMVV
jgi:glycosyltransferase involved in cell wall biosynthesis